MKILVTGGLGFLGTNLVAELKTREHEVWVTDIRHSAMDKYIRADISDYRQLDEIFCEHTFDYVFNLAAEYGRWNGEEYYENLWRTNVIGNKHLIRLQEMFGFRMIFFSSAEVYGDFEGVMSEDVMDRVPLKQMNDYAMSKWVGEMQALNSATMFGTETVRVRPVNAYGKYEHYHYYRGVIPKFIYHALRDEPYTVHSGHKRIFDYAGDTCRTIANIVDNFIPGAVYNVGGREEWEVDIKEVSDIILKILGKNDKLVKYEEAEPHTTKEKHMDFSLARKDLQHNPQVTLEEGLAFTVKWTKESVGM